MDDQRLTPFAPPATDPTPPKQEPIPDLRVRANLGARRAGLLLCANFILVVLSMMVLPAGTEGRPLGVVPMAAGALDLVIGVLLIRGSASVVNWAIFRTVAGLLLYGGISIMNHQMVNLVLQAFVSATFLVLLIGDPRRLVVNLATGGFALYGLLSVLGFLTLTGTTNPVSAALGGLDSALEKAPLRELTGVTKPYTLTFPGGWYLRKAEVAHKDNALADRWAVKRGLDVHVMTIVETIPMAAGQTIDLDRFTDVVLEHLKHASNAKTEVSRTPLTGVPLGQLVHSTVQNPTLGEMHYLHGLIVDGSEAYQIIAFARSSQWENIGRELEGIVRSFRLPGAANER